jgi:hypothetical protein
VLEKAGEITCIDHLKNKVLCRVKDETNILHTMKIRNANWIGHILCRNSLVKCDFEGNIGGGDISDEKMRRKT